MAVLIAAAAGALFFCVIVLCFGGRAAELDAVQNRLRVFTGENSHKSTVRDEEMGKPFTERVIRPIIQKVIQLLSAVLPVRRQKNSSRERLKKMLQQAGWTISPEEYTVLQLIIVISCGVLGLLLGLIMKETAMRVILLALGGMFGAYAIMRYFCSATATKRKAAMEKQLPDLLDLLSISVAAGLGFERAMAHVIDTMDGPIIDEFAVTYREMSMGRSRKDALTLLGERCGVEDLTAVTSALVQAGQLGIPIGNVLQSQAAAIRRSRRSKVQEKAAKVSTKILLPMIGLIFPVLLIVLLGPSAITILEQFGG